MNKRRNTQPTQQQKTASAKAWAEFLLDEYRKEKSLRNRKQHTIIENATNHDKLNT